MHHNSIWSVVKSSPSKYRIYNSKCDTGAVSDGDRWKVLTGIIRSIQISSKNSLELMS